MYPKDDRCPPINRFERERERIQPESDNIIPRLKYVSTIFSSKLLHIAAAFYCSEIFTERERQTRHCITQKIQKKKKYRYTYFNSLTMACGRLARENRVESNENNVSTTTTQIDVLVVIVRRRVTSKRPLFRGAIRRGVVVRRGGRCRLAVSDDERRAVNANDVL